MGVRISRPSALSGRILTTYVPLRSATERKRAAFLTPSEAVGGILTPAEATGLLNKYNYPSLWNKIQLGILTFISGPFMIMVPCSRSIWKNVIVLLS